MKWRHGMIGRHKTKRSLYVVLDTFINHETGMLLGPKETSYLQVQTSMPLEDYLNNTKVMMQLLEPVTNLEPLGDLQELLYG